MNLLYFEKNNASVVNDDYHMRVFLTCDYEWLFGLVPKTYRSYRQGKG